jgi:hypothetical protein
MSRSRGRVSTKTFAIVAILVALLLGGVVSYYASGSPDGLNRVAEDKGFISEERDSATADSPLADYSTKNVSNERLSGGLAGVVGVAVVLVIAGGLALVVRRRTPAGDDDFAEESEQATPAGVSQRRTS